MDKMQVPIHMCPEKMFKSLGGKKENFCKTVLMCGQKHRVDMILDRLTNVKKIFGFSGYAVFKANCCDKELLIANSGMYAPDTAIVMELLLCAGVETFIRLGSCGSLSSQVNIGDVVVADSAIRGDGTSRYYVDDDFSPQAHKQLSDGIYSNLAGVKVHSGPVWTTDALFREVPEIINPVIEKGAVAVDMVTSIVLTLAQMRNLNAASILAVSDVVLNSKSGFKDPAYKKAENSIIEASLNYIKSC